jgi:hypothetical protein
VPFSTYVAVGYCDGGDEEFADYSRDHGLPY